MSTKSGAFYRWNEGKFLPTIQRVDLKEKSASAAANTLSALQKEVTKACHVGVIPNSDPALVANDVTSWLQEIGSFTLTFPNLPLSFHVADFWRDSVNNEHRSNEILVGVGGSTGAGKTSLLNALLGLQEFLPSSCEQAATSVVSRVSWNYDERPDYEFRAEVHFCTRQDMTGLIKRTFQHLQDFENIQTQVYENIDDRITDQAEAQHILDDLIPKVTAVWGFTLTELHDMTPDDVLKSKPDVWSLIEKQVVHFNSSSAEALSQQVKPYLDSTADTHGSDRQFAAWPLVRDARLFVRADILKGGMSLVDLPGLGDAVESRATLAREFYDKLAVTIIVAPIVRAADETTAKSLLSRHQALQLQMSNRFNKKGMVVVLTKTDDLDIEAYLRHSPEAKKRPELAQDREAIKDMTENIKQLESESKALKKTMRRMRKLVRTLKRRAKDTKSKLQKAKAKANTKSVEKLERELESMTNEKKSIQSVSRVNRNRLDGIEREKATIANARAHRASKVTFECMSLRNDAVQGRIRADFRTDQKKFRGKRFVAKHHDIEVLAVSSQAFWRIANYEEAVPGFPRPNYTGIPGARHWLRQCTARLREDHLDLMLNKFEKLVNWISQWSRDQDDGQGDLQFTAAEIEDSHVSNHEQGQKGLNSELNDLKRQIDDSDPLGNVDKAIDKASTAAVLTVGRWSLKTPENLASTSKMHWLTYKANVCRYGGVFRARGQDRVMREYRWNESLAVLLLDSVAGSWDICINEKIPSLSGPILERIDRIWDDYIEGLASSLNDLDSSGQLATVLGPDNAMNNLDPIRQEMKRQILGVVKDISRGSVSSSSDVLRAIERRLQPVFEDAKCYSGEGSHEKRRMVIESYIKENGAVMFKEALKRMVDNYAKNRENAYQRFELIIEVAIKAVQRQLAVQLGALGVRSCMDVGRTESNELVKLRKNIQVQLAQLKSCCRVPVVTTKASNAPEHEVPRQFLSLEDMINPEGAGQDDADSAVKDGHEGDDDDLSDSESTSDSDAE